MTHLVIANTLNEDQFKTLHQALINLSIIWELPKTLVGYYTLEQFTINGFIKKIVHLVIQCSDLTDNGSNNSNSNNKRSADNDKMCDFIHHSMES